ncbi:neuronal acetylcholine receptor subunit alpha-9-II-like [Procambarus clarkii]|uniref:neuronal acetylcholine receptor subunit alpha-9-II-like n=1 Tax=Procambarus clarkii TaxID=6728 RepID=UPI001E670F8D|nr:neuronal acetylcholine receptor subunit alpha-9-II-like [Procambarus clarkii]
MILQWKDHFLSWDPASFNGTEVIRVPYKDIWYPDVILHNTADSNYELGILNTNAKIKYTGEVQLASHAFFQSTCDVNTFWYPFDQQDCQLVFASWTHTTDEVELVMGKADLSEYSPHPEYYLEDFYSVTTQVHDPCCLKPFTFVTYHLQLQRRTMFAVFFFILPGAVVNTCALMTFMLPAESGEKVSLATNALLAMMVFLMSMTQEIPPTESVPLIGRYYGGCILMLGINIVTSVFSLRCHYHSSSPVPGALSAVGRFMGRVLLVSPGKDLKKMWDDDYHSKVNSVKRRDSKVKVVQVEPPGTPGRTKASSMADEYHRRSLDALEGIHHLLANREDKTTEDSATAASPHGQEWRYLCLVLDRFFFVASVVVFAVFNLAVLMSSPHSQEFIYCPNGPGTCPADWDADRVGAMVDSGKGTGTESGHHANTHAEGSIKGPVIGTDGRYYGIIDP